MEMRNQLELKTEKEYVTNTHMQTHTCKHTHIQTDTDTHTHTHTHTHTTSQAVVGRCVQIRHVGGSNRCDLLVQIPAYLLRTDPERPSYGQQHVVI